MEDVEGRRRVRQCTTVSVGVENPCCLSANGVPFTCDRDVSATVNSCLAEYAGLVKKT